MRRRAKRDLLTLLGVAIVVAGVVLINTYMRLDTLKEAAAKLRQALEDKHRGQGVELIEWDLLRETVGKLRLGNPKFAPELQDKNGRLVNICGFMAPIDQFRDVTEFMLLPVPITCYFCESPPARDIIHVKLEKKAQMVNEPVLIGGRLKLYRKEDDDLFFYTIANAKWNQAVQDKPVTRKDIGEQHRAEHLEGFRQMREGDAPLEDGYEPPKLKDGAIKAEDLMNTGQVGDMLDSGHIPRVDMGDLLPGAEGAEAQGGSEPAAE